MWKMVSRGRMFILQNQNAAVQYLSRYCIVPVILTFEICPVELLVFRMYCFMAFQINFSLVFSKLSSIISTSESFYWNPHTSTKLQPMIIDPFKDKNPYVQCIHNSTKVFLPCVQRLILLPQFDMFQLLLLHG